MISNRKHLAVILLGAIALSFLLYGNTIGGNFVYDDKFFSERKDLNQPSALTKVWSQPFLPQHRDAGMYRPLTVFSLALNFIIFGGDTESFHVTNIVLNGAVVFLVFLLAWRLFGSVVLAFFSALFFAFLPIHTEAVAFIKSRDELLAVVFILLSWLTFIGATEGKSGFSHFRIFLSSLWFILAVLAKELVIIAPALFLLIYWLRRKPGFGQLLRVGLYFGPVLAGYLMIRYRILGEYAFGKDDTYFIINPLGTADFWVRVSTAFKIAFVYVGKTFAPINLSATYHYNQLALITNPFTSGEAVLGMAILAILIFLVGYRKTRLTPLGIGAATFLIPYLVFSKFIFKGGDILAERWMYLPSVGFSMIAGYGLARIYDRRKILGLVGLASVLAIYAYVLIGRNQVWLSNRALYESMIKTAPASIQGHLNMANLYLDNDYLEEARREAEIAFNIYRDHPPLLNIVGVIAFKDENYDLAEKAFLRAIEIRPKLPLSYSNIAKLYYKTGNYDKAEEALRNVVVLYPKPDDAMLYALTLAKLRRYNDSLGIVDRFFKDNLSNSQIKFILALDYYKLGNLAEARKYFDWNPRKTDAEKIEILKDF